MPYRLKRIRDGRIITAHSAKTANDLVANGTAVPAQEETKPKRARRQFDAPAEAAKPVEAADSETPDND